MYFPLMGAYNGYPIDRCGDIWAGYFSKHIADKLQVAHKTGEPMVIHNKASNPWTNLKKEEGEDVMGKEFIKTLLHHEEPTIHEEYFNKIKKAYQIWWKLLEKIDKENEKRVKDIIEKSNKRDVALVTQMGQIVAILRDPEIYNNRKEEIVTRMFGVIDMDHPYIKHIYSGGDYLIGGEVELLDRIRYNDGLDKWRKTAKELLAEFREKGADTVYAFQTRNPTHAGHAYLMRSAGEDLKSQGYTNPVLWLSPLGGWTKSDDVPLDVRVKQHEEVLLAG
jgi:hypothetical protein